MRIAWFRDALQMHAYSSERAAAVADGADPLHHGREIDCKLGLTDYRWDRDSTSAARRGVADPEFRKSGRPSLHAIPRPRLEIFGFSIHDALRTHAYSGVSEHVTKPRKKRWNLARGTPRSRQKTRIAWFGNALPTRAYSAVSERVTKPRKKQ